MDPDVIIMPSGRPSIVGKEEVRRLSHDYSETYEEKCCLVYDEVETAGHWGFARATVSATRTSKLDGGVEEMSLKNLWIVKRQANGEWKFWRIMFNSTIPRRRAKFRSKIKQLFAIFSASSELLGGRG